MKISEPHQLSCAEIAQKLGIKLHYGCFSLRYANYIVLKKSTKQKEWQTFGHEVGHYLRHHGNQLNMHPLFADLQEYQANYFAYHFCVPTFMLDNLKEVNADVIARDFNVEFEFALRRIEIYQNKLMWRKRKNALQANQT